MFQILIFLLGQILKTKKSKKVPNGRCSYLSDREDRDFCDGETREHVQMTSTKNFEILSTSPVPEKSCS